MNTFLFRFLVLFCFLLDKVWYSARSKCIMGNLLTSIECFFFLHCLKLLYVVNMLILFLAMTVLKRKIWMYIVPLTSLFWPRSYVIKNCKLHSQSGDLSLGQGKFEYTIGVISELLILFKSTSTSLFTGGTFY